MRIGIKYCGGCNPRYDRGEYVSALKEAYPQMQWEYAKEEISYDLLIVVCGCGSCCASYRQYKYRLLRKLWAPEDFARLSEELSGLQRGASAPCGLMPEG